MKILFLLLCFLLPATTTVALDRPAAPAAARHNRTTGQPLERIETDVIRYQKATPRIFETLDALKEAKASYIQELTAPPGNVSKYRTDKSRRQMVGVYLFDMSYASVFDRKKPVRDALEAVQQLLRSLGFNDQKVNQQYQKLVKEYGSSTVKNLVISYEKILNESLREIATTGEGAALITEAAYGWLLEGLYVTSEIVAQQNYSPLMLYRINEHAECIRPVVQLLETVKSNPQLAKYINTSDHLVVLKSISSTLKSTEKISRKEVDSVRLIISKARADILN